MQLVEAFMVFNVKVYDVEKYQLKWLRVLSVERTWVQVLYMPLYTIYFIIIFNNMLDYNE